MAATVRELVDGEFVTVLLEGVQPVQLLAIPRAAVLTDQSGDYVYVVGDDNKAIRQNIKLGQSTPTEASVLTGLQEGQTIVVDGLQRVRPGQPVAPAPAAPTRRRRGHERPAMTAASVPRRPQGHRRGPYSSRDASMISSVFVDRPRLAVVIAIVVTIAGLLSLTRIPVAQFPDIVPPQVQVAATYPGASAQVVESAVAQPLEAQIVGVDQMLYMKSSSGNDGSYNLTVSFALGSNPDIDTVNVNNRVQTALSQLPSEVQLQGLTVQKRSSAVLQFMMFYSDNGQQDPLFITNYAADQRAGRDQPDGRRRPGLAVRQAQLFDAHLVRRPAPQQSRHGALGDRQRHPVAERPGAGRPHRGAADRSRSAVPVQRADQGPPDDARGVRQHRGPGQSGRLAAAGERRGARRDGGAELRLR